MVANRRGRGSQDDGAAKTASPKLPCWPSFGGFISPAQPGRFWQWLLLLTSAALSGCAERSQTKAENAAVEQTATQPASKPSTQSAERQNDRPFRAETIENAPAAGTSLQPIPESAAPKEDRPEVVKRRPQPPDWDDALLASAGIRRLSGKHLTLFTDLPPTPAVDQLPTVFDQAVPLWCDYFERPVAALQGWRMNGYLMQDEARFRRAGLFPDDLPEFLNGFQRDDELWLFEQSSDYYRQHLLLHEGTHGFMKWAMGGAGPPWYMEGIAELLATHSWIDGRLTLRCFPRNKKDVPLWGRIQKIRDEVEQDRGRTLRQIMQYDEKAHLQLAPYAWCWAAAAFLDNYPPCRDRFRNLRTSVVDSSRQFSVTFYDQLASQEPRLTRQWQLFVLNMEYGYDLSREAIETKPSGELPPTGAKIDVLADRGWQSTGWRLDEGQLYRLEASGRFQIGKDSQPWWSEANGITLRYYRGRPLGVLLGALLEEDQPVSGITPLAAPDVIGTGSEFKPRRTGTLYLRVNDSPAELHNNAGAVTVRIEAQDRPSPID